MLETLINFDRNLFIFFNSLNSPFMDSVMWWITDRFIWIPLYIVFAVFLYRNFGNQAVFMILFAALLIVISDQGSVLMKNYFERARPCHDEVLSFTVHTVNNKCGGKFGFVSSHAANTMAVFMYLLFITKNFNRKITAVAAIWVVLVGYSRIYLGVHFPFDILGGWLVGMFAALVTYIIYRLIFDSPQTHLKR